MQTTEPDDFGFSFEPEKAIDDTEITNLSNSVEELQRQNQALAEANRLMYRKIVILLQKLRKSPEQPMIRWPDRASKIDQFIAELDELRATQEQK